MNTKSSVLIVGAGPTGLAAAVELHRRGIPARIINKAPHGASGDRATWIQSATLERLHESGASERIVREGTIQRYFVSHDLNGFVHKLDMTLAGGQYPFAVVLAQSKTEQILSDILEGFGGKVEHSTELIDLEQSNDSVQCTIRLPCGATQKFNYDHVIGADGAHSLVRKLCGIKFEGDSTDRDWTVTELRLKWPHPNSESHIYMQDDGFLMAFHMNDDNYRVMTNDGEVEKRLPSDAHLIDVQKNTSFRVRHMQASQYQKGRVYLVGDAAHIHSPFGGRGMNIGIGDAVCLAGLLWKGQQNLYTESRYNAGKESIDESRGEWEMVHAWPRWKKQVIGYGLWLALRVPAVHRMIVAQANGKTASLIDSIAL